MVTQTGEVETTFEAEATLVTDGEVSFEVLVTDGEVSFEVEPIDDIEVTKVEEIDVTDDQTDEGATFCNIGGRIIPLEAVDVQTVDCSTSEPIYSSWNPDPGAYSPGPTSDDEEAPPTTVEPPFTPILVPAWYGPMCSMEVFLCPRTNLQTRSPPTEGCP